MEKITVRGAREHNLKDINVEIPRGKFIVITGVSGSGKSSLAFDTIFAEGERRYMESLSAYARQFLEKLDKPDVDSIEGLSPSVSVDQRTLQRNPRSTVGTITEIYDFLRLFFTRFAKPYCQRCKVEISAQSFESMTERVLGLGEGAKVTIFSPIVQGRKGEYRKELEDLRRMGFLRVRVDGELRDLSQKIKLKKQKAHTIELLVDVISLRGPSGEDSRARLEESLGLALKYSKGVVRVEVDGKDKESMILSKEFACPKCGMSYPEVSPRLFSFNSPYGACPECQGIGAKSSFDPELILDDANKSIEDGVIIPSRNSIFFRRVLRGLAGHYKFSLNIRFEKLSQKIKNIILYGSSSYSNNSKYNKYWEEGDWKGFPGIVGLLSAWYENTDSKRVGRRLESYIRTMPCSGCGGARLKRESLNFRVNVRSIYDISRMTVEECEGFFRGLKLSPREVEIAGRILKEIGSRLGFLKDVGLGYLSLERSAPTLSGGEAQRVRLATQLGSKLVGVTYVLDEPSIGLHHRDNKKLIDTLKKLKSSGNSIIVVEHDEETIKSSDFIVDMGPGAGEKGGEIVTAGDIYSIIQEENSITGKYLSKELTIPIPRERRKPKGFLKVVEAGENNLKDIDASFPLGLFICVTGVSGSGKSTLILDTLYNALASRLYKSKDKPGKHREIIGGDQIDKVAHVDQSPIGRTPRSNPATYTGVFTPIRELFAMLPEARMRGYNPGRFSFNVKSGRCSACQGDGEVKIEMHFLPDVYVRCETCGGKRYNRETLEVRYRGKSIAGVLDMTVSEAFGFFENVPNIKAKLEVLNAVGLGYIRLGQPATTLSGGEAQRIKLTRELSKRSTGRTLYILDEPTVGLHFDDVKRLLEVIHRLTDMGNTVIVIEHNMDVIKSADHIIDLGPEGGEKGGYIVACGTPEEVTQVEGSYTGMFLKKVL